MPPVGGYVWEDIFWNHPVIMTIVLIFDIVWSSLQEQAPQK